MQPTPTPTPTLLLRPATPSDYSPITTHCAAPAFAPDALHLATFPSSLSGGNPSAENEWRLARFRKRCAAGLQCWVVVEEGSGDIAGMAIWTPPAEVGKEGKEEGEGEGVDAEGDRRMEEASAEDGGLECPACARREVFETSVRRVEEVQRRIWGTGGLRGVWHLNGIATTPSFQRRGVGATLVRWGIEQAERDGVPVHLEATPAGKPLYDKLGFETVAMTDMADLLPEGVEYVVCSMVKWPSGSGAE